MSFGWGIGALHRLDAATKLPCPRRPPHSISRAPVYGELGAPGRARHHPRRHRAPLAEYGVVIFRDQLSTPEHRLAFARRFGGVDLKRFFAAVPGYPMIAQVRTVPEQRRRPDLIKPQTRSA